MSIQTVLDSGSPSESNGWPRSAGSDGSEYSVTRSSITFSPIRVPPPDLENGLRPSSAVRALSAPLNSGTRSVTADGSSTAVYRPGSIACGFRLATAFCAAMRPIAAGSTWPQSRAPPVAHPLPVPSGVRAVTEKSASVERW